MRGKLRDKRASEKRDHFKHDLIERRRPGKRNRISWSEPEEDDFDENNFDLENDEADTADEKIVTLDGTRQVVKISPHGAKPKSVSK